MRSKQIFNGVAYVLFFKYLAIVSRHFTLRCFRLSFKANWYILMGAAFCLFFSIDGRSERTQFVSLVDPNLERFRKAQTRKQKVGWLVVLGLTAL